MILHIYGSSRSKETHVKQEKHEPAENGTHNGLGQVPELELWVEVPCLDVGVKTKDTDGHSTKCPKPSRRRMQIEKFRPQRITRPLMHNVADSEQNHQIQQLDAE